MNRNKLCGIIAAATLLCVGGSNISVHADEMSSNIAVSNAKSTVMGKVVNVGTSTLRVRKEANTSSTVLASLKEGDTFTIKSKSGNWYCIDYNGVVGYVSADYVQELTSANNNTNSGFSSTNATTGKVVNVGTSTLRMRKEPSTSSTVLASLKEGDTFTIKSKSNGWYCIVYNGVTGYISADYVQEITSSNGNTNTGSGSTNNGNSNSGTSTTSTTGKVVNVGTSTLRMRKEPSTSSTVLASLKEGDTFTIKSKSNGWYCIVYNGVTGYVSADYVQEITSSSGNTNTGSGSTNNGNSNSGTSTTSTTGKVVNVGTSTLRMRKEPNTSSTVLASLKEGDTFTIKSKSNGWYCIVYNGVTGYVSADYVQETTSSDNNNNNTNTGSGSNNSGSSNSGTTTTATTGKVINVGTSTLRLRQEPSTSSTVLASLKEGDKFTIKSKSNGWYCIVYNGVTGYVSADYVQEITSSDNNNNNTNTGSDSTNNGGSSNSGTTTTSTVGKVVNIGTSTLRLRKEPNTSSTVLASLKEGDKFTIISKADGWYKISYNNIVGYVSGAYVEELKDETIAPPTTPDTKPSIPDTKPSTPDTTPSTPNESTDVAFTLTGQVYNTGGTGLNLRENANSSAKVLVSIPEGTVINVTAKNGSWYKTSYNGYTGYVSASYVREVTNTTPDEGTNSKYEQVLAIMKAQIGSPYVWGGTGEFITDSLLDSLKAKFPIDAANGYYDKIEAKYINSGYRAFDCSGLMQWSFNQVGIKLNRVVSSQINNGVAVDLDSLKPGDLLFNKGLTHVGMYVGDNMWIESPRPGEYVRMVAVPWSTIAYARRVL